MSDCRRKPKHQHYGNKCPYCGIDKLKTDLAELQTAYDELKAGRSTRDCKDCDNQLYTVGYAEGVQAERERCAKIAEDKAALIRDYTTEAAAEATALSIAAAIRRAG